MEEERYGTAVGRDHVKSGGHLGANEPGAFGVGAWLTLKPVQIHVVGTVVQGLVQDCTAAAGENEKQGWRVFKSTAATAPFLTGDATRERALTFGGQPSGVSGRRGETESGGERLRRAGHHTYTVNVSGWELPPPGRTSEVFVVALTDTETGSVNGRRGGSVSTPRPPPPFPAALTSSSLLSVPRASRLLYSRSRI